MTTSEQDQIKGMVRDQWSTAAEAWGAQHDALAEMSQHVTAALVDAADLSPGLHVLDLAGGTGEPALTVARRVEPGGNVVCSDLVEPMLAAAAENAKKRGLANMTFQTVDMEQIPFEDARFDRVTSRFGVMFATAPPRAFSEIRRVLKPGGRVAFAVWATAAENPNFTVINSVLQAHGLLQPPPPAVPTPFTYAEPGSLSAVMREGEFRDVQEDKRQVEWTWPGSPETFIRFMRATLPNVRKALDEAPPDVGEEIRAALGKFYDGERVRLGATVHIASALK